MNRLSGFIRGSRRDELSILGSIRRITASAGRHGIARDGAGGAAGKALYLLDILVLCDTLLIFKVLPYIALCIVGSAILTLLNVTAPESQFQAILPLILGGLALASQIGSSIGQAGATAEANEKNYEYNRALAQYAYSQDLAMWNRQNAYNTPEAQMLRFKKAGLNPNLIYGQGSSGNATQLPKYQAPTVDFKPVNYVGQIPEALSMFQDMQVKQAQVDNLRAQNDVIKAEAEIKGLTSSRLDEYLMRRNTLMFQKQEGGIFNRDAALAKLYAVQLDNQLKEGLLPHQLEYAKGRNRSMALDIERKSSLLPSDIEFAKGRNAKQAQEILRRSLLLKHEVSNAAGKNRMQAIDQAKRYVEMDKMKADTEMQKTRNDWYVTQLMGKLGIDILGGINKGRKLPDSDGEKWRRFERSRGRQYDF